MSPREDVDSSNQSPTVDLIFKVWAPKLNRSAHRLFLLGSLKPMGAWNMKAATEAQPTPDVHIWKVEIPGVPIKSAFEWSWVRATPDRRDLKWERMLKRNSFVDTFGGVIHTIYGDEEEVFVQSVACAEVSTYRKVKEGQILVLSGSSYTTGLWDLMKAVKAVESPWQSGYWKAQIVFDSNSSLQFKWAIVREKDRALHVIERESHSMFGRQTWMRVVAPWNLPRMFVVDTPVAVEPLDHVMGRTDVLVSTKKMRSEVIRKWLKMDPKLNTPDLFPINQVPTPKAPPQTQATPTKTNQEMAKQAFISMSTPSIVTSAHSPSPSTSRTPTVKPLDNLEDHAKKRADALNRTERQQQSKQKVQEVKYAEGPNPIKGKGQTLVAKTSALEMMNEQPLVDEAIMGLVHVTERGINHTLNDMAPETSGTLSRPALSSTSSDTSVKTKSTPSEGHQAKPIKFFSGDDLMMGQMEELKVKFKSFEEPEKRGMEKGMPAIERDVSRVSSYPPPTWSMLQEAELIKSCNPILTPSSQASKKTPTTTVQKKVIVLKPHPPLSTQMTTPDSFMPRPSSDKAKPFVMAKGTGKEMSVVGRDDTMKSPSEVQMEFNNRKMWEVKGQSSYEGNAQSPSPATTDDKKDAKKK